MVEDRSQGLQFQQNKVVYSVMGRIGHWTKTKVNVIHNVGRNTTENIVDVSWHDIHISWSEIFLLVNPMTVQNDNVVTSYL